MQLGFLFISTRFSDLDKQELSSAVEELRHRRGLADVTEETPGGPCILFSGDRAAASPWQSATRRES